MSILHAAIGESLSSLVKPPITQEQLNRYADASGDHNPIHLDEEAARHVGLDSVIAHGMLSMAFLGQFVSTLIAGVPGAYIEWLKVRFTNTVHVGDTITCHGVLKERTAAGAGHAEAGSRVTLECWAQNQKGDKVTTGVAIVSIPLAAER
jgi:acyl dehydratase